MNEPGQNVALNDQFIFSSSDFNSVICGISAYYDSSTRDRRWRFFTCVPSEYVYIESETADSIMNPNKNQATFQYFCSDGYFISAFRFTSMSSTTKDRSFYIRCASFKYTSTDDEEFKTCWSLVNLQPMWAEDNREKSSKWDGGYYRKGERI